MKTPLTRALEQTLYAYWEALGATAVEEVTLPNDAGIVDTLVRQRDATGTVTWRCFELKVSASDFRSKAKLSFVGHYNYFVLPAALYPKVQAEIPTGIGVMTYAPFDHARIAASALPIPAPGQLTNVRPPRRKSLAVPEAELNSRFIASLDREVQKAKRGAQGLAGFSADALAAELRKRTAAYDIYHPDANLYDRLLGDMTHVTVQALAAEVDALNAELAALKLGGGA